MQTYFALAFCARFVYEAEGLCDLFARLFRRFTVTHQSHGTKQIPENVLTEIRKRDELCVYCHKRMAFLYNAQDSGHCATIEHLNFDGPFLSAAQSMSAKRELLDPIAG